MKYNNVNAVRKAKRFFASDFLKATKDSEPTNITSRDVLRLSKLSTEPAKRKRKKYGKRDKVVVQMGPRPQRAVRLDYAILNETGERVPLNQTPVPIPHPMPEIQPIPQPVQEVQAQPVQSSQRRSRVNYAELNRIGRTV